MAVARRGTVREAATVSPLRNARLNVRIGAVNRSATGLKTACVTVLPSARLPAPTGVTSAVTPMERCRKPASAGKRRIVLRRVSVLMAVAPRATGLRNAGVIRPRFATRRCVRTAGNPLPTERNLVPVSLRRTATTRWFAPMAAIPRGTELRLASVMTCLSAKAQRRNRPARTIANTVVNRQKTGRMPASATRGRIATNATSAGRR